MSGPFGKIHNKKCCCGGVGCCPHPIGDTVYVSGGLIEVGDSVALTCEACPSLPQDDFLNRIYRGEYTTPYWLYSFGYGSFCSETHRWSIKIRLDFTWNCGTGFTLAIGAEVAENQAGYDPLVVDSLIDTDSETVEEGCSPLLNIFENICVASGFLYVPNGCFDPINRCPETYTVTE